MILMMKREADKTAVNRVEKQLEQMGCRSVTIRSSEGVIISVTGGNRSECLQDLALLPEIERVIDVTVPYKLASREIKKEKSMLDLQDGVSIGGKEVIVMAGPCAVESEKMLFTIAEQVARAGARVLRGGAFKPRTSPYSFQGLEEKGLKILAEAGKRTGLKIVPEVISPQDVELVACYADILQVGARNMQNYSLLRKLGKQQKPVLLKRGFSATIEEWLMSAEYILAEGNFNVILCERGIRTFETYTRNTLDISAVPLVKNLSHLPVIVDPSHSSGDSRLVPALSRAAIASGADGLLIEVHPHPEEAFCDGNQSLNPREFQLLMNNLADFTRACERTLNTDNLSAKNFVKAI